jgi:RNA polymerase sigma factor (sigma-70 family)
MAEDVAQEALIRVLRKLLTDASSVSDLEGFVCGVARHVIADLQRRESRRTTFDGEKLPREAAAGRTPRPPASPQSETLCRLVEEEMDRLPPSDQRVLRDCFINGFSCAELSRRTAEPAARLRKRKSRAIRRLRKQVRGRPELSALRYWTSH